ncbi:MAG: hypothetical protein ACT4OX_04885 [Actinomycetota bacterium]
MGDSPASISGPLIWHPIPGTAATLMVTDDDTLLVRWTVTSTCFGSGDRYVRILVDGAEATTAPLSGVIGHTEPFPPAAVESPIVVETSVPVAAGEHVVTLETAIVMDTTCVIGPPTNHLIIEVLD